MNKSILRAILLGIITTISAQGMTLYEHSFESPLLEWTDWRSEWMLGFNSFSPLYGGPDAAAAGKGYMYVAGRYNGDESELLKVFDFTDTEVNTLLFHYFQGNNSSDRLALDIYDGQTWSYNLNYDELPLANGWNMAIADLSTCSSNSGVQIIFRAIEGLGGATSLTALDEIYIFGHRDDLDEDGLPDAWEKDQFGDLGEHGDDDYDGDTQTNLEEYQNDTDPTDALSSTILGGGPIHSFNFNRSKYESYETQFLSYFTVHPDKSVESGTIEDPSGNITQLLEIPEQSDQWSTPQAIWSPYFSAIEWPQGTYKIEIRHTDGTYLRFRPNLGVVYESDFPYAPWVNIQGEDDEVSLSPTFLFYGSADSFDVFSTRDQSFYYRETRDLSSENFWQLSLDTPLEPQKEYAARIMRREHNGNVTLFDTAMLLFTTAMLDVDKDGIDDLFEQQIVDADPDDDLQSVDDVNGLDDFDGDGLLNQDEYVAGTNPAVPDSGFNTVEEGLAILSEVLTEEAQLSRGHLSLAQRCFSRAVQADFADYKARICSAIGHLLNITNEPDLHALLADFGTTLNALFELDGDIDLATAPLLDFAVDRFSSNAEEQIDASLNDLEAIPNTWSGRVEFSTTDLPLDEAIHLDRADLTFMKSALHLLRSHLLGTASYALNIDYDRLENPVIAPVVDSGITAPEEVDWDAVPNQLVGEYGQKLQSAKVAVNDSKIFIQVEAQDLPNANEYYLGGELHSASGEQIEFFFYHTDEGENQYIWFNEAGLDSNILSWNYSPSNSYTLIQIDLPANITVSDVSLDNLGIGGSEYIDYYGYYDYWSDGLNFPKNVPASGWLDSHPEFLERVRNEARLQESRDELIQTLDLFLAADALANARTDYYMHMIEYAPADEAIRRKTLDHIRQMRASLDAPVNYDYVSSEAQLFETVVVHLGAFYTPDYLTRATLPEFWGLISQPLDHTFPDPTFGGILPGMSQIRLTETLRRNGISLDEDDDGMPNGWEYLYGGHPTRMEPYADSDLDHQRNLEEYIAGTNPTNATSVFTTQLTIEPDGTPVLSWPAVEEREYHILWSDSLENGFNRLEWIEYPQNSYKDALNSNQQQGFYKVEVETKGPQRFY